MITKKNGLNLQSKFFHTTTTIILIISIFTLGLPCLAQSSSTKLGFTGEQVFRGILFGEGEVAKLFPEIWDNDSQLEESEQGQISVKEEIISFIKIQYPDFMDWFGQETQSGNHIRIQKALDEASEKSKIATTSLGLKDLDAEPVDSEAGIAVAVAVAVAVWIWRYLWRYDSNRTTSYDKSSSILFRENLIDAIATKLDKS